ncbi:hypothetical protein KY360_04820 [Candidatus Woesearchaeota archaeon]|nr:hypothetical protein [Candidatus Woesearchaeota archaeon]
MDEMRLYYEAAPAEEGLAQKVDVAFHVVRTGSMWKDPEANTRAKLWKTLGGIMFEDRNWTRTHDADQYHFYTGELTPADLDSLLMYVSSQEIPIEYGIPQFDGIQNPFNGEISKERIGYGFFDSKRFEKPAVPEGGLGLGFGYGYMSAFPFRSKLFGARWDLAKGANEFYRKSDAFKGGKALGVLTALALYACAAVCGVALVDEFVKK